MFDFSPFGRRPLVRCTQHDSIAIAVPEQRENNTGIVILSNAKDLNR